MTRSENWPVDTFSWAILSAFIRVDVPKKALSWLQKHDFLVYAPKTRQVAPDQENCWGLLSIPLLLPCQGAMVGVDVVGEDAVNKLLGPNRKHARQSASRGGGTAVNSRPEEERSAWEDTPIDMEACVDNETRPRYEISRSCITMASLRLHCLK